MTEQEQLAEIKALVQDTNQRLGHLEGEFQNLKGQFKEIEKETTEINQRLREFDIRIDTYQKASQQVVNLAFGLIVAATASLIVQSIFK